MQHAYTKIGVFSKITLVKRNVKLQSSRVVINIPVPNPALPASSNEAVRNDRVICNHSNDAKR